MSSEERVNSDSACPLDNSNQKSNHFNSKLSLYEVDISNFEKQLWQDFQQAHGEVKIPREMLPGLESCIEITRKENNYFSRKLLNIFYYLAWQCFALIHPTAGYLTQELDSAFCELFAGFTVPHSSLKTQGFRILDTDTLQYKHKRLLEAFRVSPLSPEWHIRTHTLKSRASRIVDVWMLLEPELLSSAPPLTTIADEIHHVFESLVDTLYRVVSELELRAQILHQHLGSRESTVEQVTSFPDGLDTSSLPDYPRKSSDGNLNASKDVMSELDYNKSPPWYIRLQQYLGSPVNVFDPPPIWRQVTLLAGAQYILIITIALFCMGGAATVVVAAAWDPEISPAPNVDGNFYSALSGCSMSLGGTYCIVIPLLQGDRNPIRDKTWNRVFHTFIWLACAAALASAIAYLYTEAASLLLAYLSALFQLVATIMWVTFSSKRIKNLEFKLSSGP